MAVPPETLEGSGVGFASTGAAAPGGAPTEVFPVPDWDRYVFVRRLGEGGMGAVYEARDLRLGRVVALKFIRGADPRLRMRMAQEARAQARLDHPNVCKVFEVGEVDGKAYIAMELVDGLPLGALAVHLSLHEKVLIVRDVALALHEAHKLGILHRDVKPSNILVETGEDRRLRPIVMDFGIAREEGGERGLTETGALLGTPAYMSPEQARGGGRGLDRRADVYSVGATLYELLAGGPPFDGESVMAVVLAVLHEEPARLRARVRDIPEDLETIVSKCLSKQPGDRYDSAKALADDLDRYVAGDPIEGKRESLLRRVRRRAEKHRALVATAALGLAAAGVAGGLALRAQNLARHQAAALEIEARTGRELGQDVKEMEWFLRAAHLLPLHDVTRERTIVRERMARIAERTPVSSAGAALVDYAVGRGHLALREDAEAHERLSRAARAGLDTPELHYALGLVGGRLYQRELVEVRRGGAPSWIDGRTRELEARYLAPALASMDRSRGVRLEAPSYLDGLVAFYRKDYEGALRLAEKAREEAPWLHEGLQLEAEVHLARGVERKNRGENAGADLDLDRAAKLFDAAAEVGRSDGALYEGGAEARVRRMELSQNTGTWQESDYATAVDRCAQAALARPDRAEPYTELAYAHLFAWTNISRGASGDDRAVLGKGLAAAQRALEIGRGDFATYERLSGANQSAAVYEMDHGLDARRSLDQAVASARRAIALSPSHPWGHTALATSHIYLALVKARSGEDPTEDLRTTIEECDRATALDPGYVIGYSNVLESYVQLARWRAEHGRDPGPETQRAGEAFAACTRANPSFADCFQNMGGVEAGDGAYRVGAGMDAREVLGRARANLQQAARLSKNLENRQRLAQVHLLGAEDARQRRDDPRPALEALGETLDGCYRFSAADLACTLLEARRELFLADPAPRSAPAPSPANGGKALARARALALGALGRGARDAGAYAVLAAAEERLAAGEPRPSGEKHRAAGLEACGLGLALDPNHPGLHLTRGLLLLHGARAAAEAGRRGLAEGARDALKRSFALNPLLRRRGAGALEEAERLAGAR